ncbi:MAG: sodium-coupled permease [Planctomycetales bacterium]|nr:sodium-coupled permease [Planctomycetales bacterium]
MFDDWRIQERSRLIGALVAAKYWISAGSAWGAQSGASRDSEAATEEFVGGLATIDWVIIAVYGFSTIALGWYFGRRQQSTKEYFVGSGGMNPFLIGVSLFASLLSTISYLSMPGEVAGKGPSYLALLLAFPLGYLVISYWMLPVYMQQKVTSAYELLENRLSLGLRLLGASMFLAMRLVWMSLLIYLAAKAMSLMMYGDNSHVTQIVWITGIVSVFYASIGGLRAVVITDLIQTILLFGGALLVVATVTYRFGGLGWFPTDWQSHWDSQPLFSFDPGVRVTVFGSVISVMVWFVCTSGGDQVSVQRFMATTDANAARGALATQVGVTLIVQITLGIVGFALLGFYAANQEAIPMGLSLKQSADNLFPQFIAHELPIGVAGLVVAAMFAAAMSSIDSGVNSITAVVSTDFLDRFGFRPSTEKSQVLVARFLAFSIGVAVIYGSSYIGAIEGNITAVTNKTVNTFAPPLFALFVFALFIPFAHPIGVWIGTLCAIVVSLIMAFSGAIVLYLADHFQIDPGTFGTAIVTRIDPDTQENIRTAADPISFQWIGPVALLVNIVVGCALSWVLTRGKVPASHDSATN